MSLRIDRPNDYQEDVGNLILAITYAESQGIPILNFSGGFVNDSNTLRNTINNYSGLFICASGNSNDNIEASGCAIYPAVYNYSIMITISASTSSDTKVSFSNYGKTTVHLFAPGENIRGSRMNGACLL